jgi:hypothetical protein
MMQMREFPTAGSAVFRKAGKFGFRLHTSIRPAASAEDYLKRFDSVTGAIKKINAICGFCYTQVTDVQQEVNGIMDIERNFKVDPEALREINLR